MAALPAQPGPAGTAAQVFIGASDGDCWYDDPYFKTKFNGICDHKVCFCDAVEIFAMGREPGAMCHHSQPTDNKTSIASTAMATATTTVPSPYQEIAAARNGSYWGCADAIFDGCWDKLGSPAECTKCAAAVTSAGVCTSGQVEFACRPDAAFCAAGVEYACGHRDRIDGEVDAGSCLMCAFGAGAETTLMEAHCNASAVSEACTVDTKGSWPNVQNTWSDYIFELGCFMNGTWYSTKKEGLCADDDTEECWWKLAETKRTVNQSCVDDRVVTAVKVRRPECWEACTGTTGSNITQPCFLSCLFDTILGNATLGVKPMTATGVAAAFVKAFEPAAEGGCPTVHASPSAASAVGQVAAPIRQPIVRADPWKPYLR